MHFSDLSYAFKTCASVKWKSVCSQALLSKDKQKVTMDNRGKDFKLYDMA